LINVYTPHAKLIHHELVSRSQLDEHYDFAKFDQQWRDVIVKGDPYFNRNLSRDHESFTIEREGFDVVYAGQPLFAAASVRRILVVKLDHIGDCITALPAVRRLKSHFPEARISVLAAPGTHAIWNSEPAVDEAIEFSFFHARSGAGRVEVSVHELDALKARLAVKRFDLAIDLRKQPDTRHILECSGARILVGFDAAGGFPWLDVALEWDEDVPLRSKHGHVAFDLVALVEAVATRCAPDRGALLTRPQGELALPAAERRRLYAKPLICVHPAAGSAMRQWPPESFAELIRLFVDLRRFNVAIIGGNDEKELADRVLQLVARPGEVINLVGRLALAELPKVLADSVLFVGNNSGPHHWAAGLGVPTVGIHSGVVDAREWGPLGPQAVAVRRDMSCSPCFIEHAEDCPRKLACLKELAVADVYDACMSMI
jgi:ADP-heptose:LPS heptosyltransferase